MAKDERPDANAEALRIVKGFAVSTIESWPRDHPERIRLLKLARPIAACGARKVGDWTRPPGLPLSKWWENAFVLAREGALDDIVERAVFGGRRPWRNQRKARRGSKFHGWIHKQHITFSTFVYRNAKWDFRDWLKIQYQEFDSGDLEAGGRVALMNNGISHDGRMSDGRPIWAPYDPFLDALRDDLPAVEAAARKIKNGKQRDILTTLLARGYNFVNPRKSRGMVSEFAKSRGISPQKASQLLGAAKTAVVAELKN